MIRGIGMDIIEVERIAQALERPGFLAKIMTPRELDCLGAKSDKPEHIAGRFAAKEAIVKALGTGLGPVGFHDIEILTKPSGMPYAELSGPASAIADNANVFITITHVKAMAAATAIIEEA